MAEGYAVTLALAFLVGCGHGIMHPCIIALLSDTDNPSRNFAAMYGLQLVLAAGLSSHGR